MEQTNYNKNNGGYNNNNNRLQGQINDRPANANNQIEQVATKKNLLQKGIDLAKENPKAAIGVGIGATLVVVATAVRPVRKFVFKTVPKAVANGIKRVFGKKPTTVQETTGQPAPAEEAPKAPAAE